MANQQWDLEIYMFSAAVEHKSTDLYNKLQVY